MQFNSKQGGTWRQGTPKRRVNGQWEPIGGGNTDSNKTTTTTDDSGFTWDQTFADTSWLYEADENGDLEVDVIDSLDFDQLEEAANKDTPNIIVFEVGGVIEIPGHNWRIKGENTWIAGETAPWPGITIIKGRTRFHERNQICSHMTFLQGDEGIDEFDSTVDVDHESRDVIFDHCTAGFGTEENLAITRDGDEEFVAKRPSFINNIIAEGLFDNPHHDDTRARGFVGTDENTEDVLLMGNLFAHHARRQPLMRPDAAIINNYIYNYAVGHFDGDSGNIMNFNGGPTNKTVIGNHYEPGGQTEGSRPLISYDAYMYEEDTMWDDDARPLTDGSQTILDEPPLVPDGLDLENDVLPAADVPEFCKSVCGPRPADRPPYEDALINGRLNEDAAVIDSQDDVGGYPGYDETSHTLDVPEEDIVDWVMGYKDEVEGTA